jgi:hypothetical protein
MRQMRSAFSWTRSPRSLRSAEPVAGRWGTKADEEAYAKFGEMRCAFHDQRLNYVVVDRSDLHDR